MNELFAKPAGELTYKHVESLIGVVAEDHTTEFKAGLSMEGGGKHPWETEKSRKVDDHARDDILKEVVAFANSDGGNMVLGVAQSKDAEHRAVMVRDIPDCKILADRLRQLSSSYIEPPCLGIEWIGICRNNKSEDGIVLIRVPRSRNAPHRLKARKEFYIRRGQDSEPMTMQEIRDVTLRRASEFEELEARLNSRREKMRQRLENRRILTKHCVALRITSVPIHARAQIHRVYKEPKLFPALRSFAGSIAGHKVSLDIPDSVQEIKLMPVRPILRGGRRTFKSEDQRFSIEQEVHGDGLAEIFFNFEPQERPKGAPVYTNWVMGFLANALIVAKSVLEVAELPNAELALDMEIGSSLIRPILVGFTELQYQGVADMERGAIQTDPLQLPRYTILNTDDFSVVAGTLLNDLRESAGLPGFDDFKILL